MKLSIALSKADFTLGIAAWWGPSYLTLSLLFFTLNFDWPGNW